MFRDKLYFMTRKESISYNRVMGAPGAKHPNRADRDRYDSLEMRVKDLSILRTETGHIPYMPVN